jgi:uncharacterized Zn-binding protein involved in type VI secretion
MGKPAARILDNTTHGTPAMPGLGSLNVLIGKKLAWRTILDTNICPVPIAPPAPAPHGPEKCYLGSTTVLINNQMACRVGDILQGAGPPNPFILGEFTVLIGDAGFGMASPASMAAFAAAMSDLEDDWDSLTPDQRKAALEAAVNAALPPGMPHLTIAPTHFDSARRLGELHFQNWQLAINEDLLNGAMTHDSFARLSNTVYHESRHGEQWYHAAQYRAAQGEDADDIARNTGVPQNVAEAAHDNPAPAGTSEGAIGEAVNTSVYGDRREHREGVLTDLGQAHPAAGTYDQYRALPEEEDAWRQGDAAEQAFRNTP